MRCLTVCCAASFASGWLITAAAAPAELPTPNGNVMLTNVLATVQRHASISARLRQQTKLGEYTQVGSGVYRQQGTAERPLTYWEMNTQVAGQTSSLVQIFDGNYLWTDRRLPSGRHVKRLDVELLQSRWRTQNPQATLLRKAMGQGGLAQMLAELIQNFDFDRPQPAQLGELPVYALLGTWRLDQLQLIWPAAPTPETAESPPWPEQIPHHVLVLVGHNMFPYFVELRGQQDAHLANTVAGWRPTSQPLLRYELFEVQFARALDPQQFLFKDVVEWKDETSQVWEALRRRGTSS